MWRYTIELLKVTTSLPLSSTNALRCRCSLRWSRCCRRCRPPRRWTSRQARTGWRPRRARSRSRRTRGGQFSGPAPARLTFDGLRLCRCWTRCWPAGRGRRPRSVRTTGSTVLQLGLRAPPPGDGDARRRRREPAIPRRLRCTAPPWRGSCPGPGRVAAPSAVPPPPAAGHSCGWPGAYSRDVDERGDRLRRPSARAIWSISSRVSAVSACSAAPARTAAARRRLPRPRPAGRPARGGSPACGTPAP